MQTQRRVRLFRNGRNQAVRIPREFELEGDEAILRREGNRLIVEPVKKGRLLSVLAGLKKLDETLPETDDDLRDFACRIHIHRAQLTVSAVGSDMDSYCGVTCHDHDATEQHVDVGGGFLPADHCLFPKALRSRVRRIPFTAP